MRLIDSFKLSLNSILRRRLRAWLTLLGIIIGVAAVISIVSIGEGAAASVSESLSGFGADIITVSPGFSRAGSFGGGMRGPAIHGPQTTGQNNPIALSTEEPELRKLDATIIKGNPNVRMINEVVSGREELVFGAETVSASIKGINPVTWTEFEQLELESGRFLTASEKASIVIGGRLANETFTRPITVGRRVIINNSTFSVVGVLTEGSTVYMPYSSAWNVTDVNKNTYSSIQAKVTDVERMEETTEELTASLRLSRKVIEKDQDFTVISSLSIQERISEVLGTLTLFLSAIAAVSLLVGAVGIANSMFTSVLEKTKEIGIMKALGSTNEEIMQLFMIESGLFGLSGGIIGVVIGLVGAGLISMLLGGMTTIVSIELMILAIVSATLIGVISGVFPARAASQLKPIDALRYE